MIWLIASLIIPFVFLFLIFISASEDFWDIIRLRISIGRLFGDLIHIFFIIIIGLGSEGFSLFMLVTHFL